MYASEGKNRNTRDNENVQRSLGEKLIQKENVILGTFYNQREGRDIGNRLCKLYFVRYFPFVTSILQSMDFQNVNPLNVRLNRFSGNLLPMTSDDALFPVAWRIYSAVIWLIEAIQTSAVIPGILFVPRDKALQDATVGLVITIEVFFLLRQMHARRDLVTQLIQKLNEILRVEDKTMEMVVRSTLKPVEIPLKFYCVAGTGSILVWCCMSFAVIFKKEYFLYQDYRLPIVLSKQPFPMEIFLLGNCVATVASVYMFIKKVALDVYMINFVLLVTAQYRYIAVKLPTVFRENAPQNQRSKSEGEKYSAVDSSAVLKMKALCRHHNAVVQ